MNLFDKTVENQLSKGSLGAGTTLLRGFALRDDAALLATLKAVTAKAPFRHMVTPGGFRMSVALTNCGALGWVTDRAGYRYDAIDPATGKNWPSHAGALSESGGECSRGSRLSRICSRRLPHQSL